MSSNNMEDTMDVDDDMQMDQDPTVGELPMSTDEDSVHDAAGGMKVVDDAMASDSPVTAEIELPTEMDSDSVGYEQGGSASSGVNAINIRSETTNAPTDSKDEGNSELTEHIPEVARSESDVNDDQTSSSKDALQEGDKNDEASSSSGACDEEQVDRCQVDGDFENEGGAIFDGAENDPLVTSDRGSRTDLNQVDTSNHSDSEVNALDPFEAAASDDNSVGAHEQSNSSPKAAENTSQEKEDAPGSKDKTQGKSLAEELNEIACLKEVDGKPESKGAQENDTISLGDSSVGANEADHVSIDGSSDGEGEGNPPDHVSVDSDSDREGCDGSTDKNKPSDGPPDVDVLDHTVPIEDELEPISTTGDAVASEEGPASGPAASTEQAAGDEAASSEETAPPNQTSMSELPVPVCEFVVSDDDEIESPANSQPPKPSGSFKGQITLIGKVSDSEMIVGPVVASNNIPSNASPSGTRTSVSDSPQRVMLVDIPKLPSKSHYSVRKTALLTHAKCLHCATNQRCPWKVTIGKDDYFICSDKCLEAHRVQRRQIVENGAPPMSNIVQTKDLSGVIKKCSFCSALIQKSYVGCLTWEVMDFCDEDCLSKYQAKFTSKCCNCNSPVATSSMGKYCVRFGHEVKQFCSPNCLDTYKKGIKTCSYCQKNLQHSSEGFLAAAGGKDQFRDFCSKSCLEKYDCVCNNSSGAYVVDNCIVCDNMKVTQFELLSNNKVAKLCSDVCLAAYKFVNNIEVGICVMCNKYYDTHRVDESITFHHDTPTTFCSKHCMNISVISKRKIVPCAWCKAKKYNFDMVYKRGLADDEGLYVCSINCLALHSVSLKAMPPRKVTCSFCKKLEISTYHITMSDATVRHFCCYDCVIGFRNSFSNVNTNSNMPVPEVAGAPKKVTKPAEAAVTNNSTPAPATNTGLAIHSIGTLKAVEPGSPILIPTSNTNKPKHATLKIPSSFCFKPPEMKNRWTQISVCKVDKCLSCRPKKEERDVQCSLGVETINGEREPKENPDGGGSSTVGSEDNGSSSTPKAVIPIPVPIYVPYPMAMYTLPSPVPLPIPVPIIVPIIIPTSLENMDRVIDTMKEILEKSLGKSYCSENNSSTRLSSSAGPSNASDEVVKMALNNLESESHVISDDKANDGKHGRKRVHEVDDEEGDESDEIDDDSDELPSKKSRLVESSAQESSPQPAVMKLKHILGLTTMKYFVKKWNKIVEDENDHLKVDIFSMRPHELNRALTLFIQKSKQAIGTEYRPDLKFYLSLGIQYSLFVSGRVDDIFGDTAYQDFTDALDAEARTFLAGNDVPTSRVEEEHLWESMQLGAKSPQVLLMTLMYFITLHLKLWTVDEHMALSFCSFELKHGSSSHETNQGSKFIKLIFNSTSLDGSDSKKPKEVELLENKKDFMRCPVRFYEFYLTKCPENIKSQKDRFYLMPESSCIPESPVWYRSLALPRHMVEKMLNRVKMIKEVCESMHEHLNLNSSTSLESAE